MSDLAIDFACPGGERKAHLARILPAYVQDITVGFLHRKAEAIAANSTGLLAMLENFSETLASLEVARLAPTYNLALATAGESDDVSYAAALLGAHLTAQGRPGTWSARFLHPHRVRFGRLLTPELIAVTVEGHALSYQTASGERCTTSLTKGADGILEIAAVDLGDGRSILIPDTNAGESMAINPHEGHTVSDLPTRVYEVEKAVSLTREHAPEYVEWHADVVQAMAGLPIITEGTVTSRTVPGQIGIVYVSSPCWGIRMAESLIHEAAHQYFYAAFQELFWTNLEDEKLYYSPYKKMDRPIERMLLAYHAFANIVLFYRKVLATTTQERLRAWTVPNLKRHEEDLAPFSGYLQQSPGLTRDGRRMFETLRDKLAR